MAHECLLHKVSAFAIRGSVVSWICDFLTGSRQYVSVKGESSVWKDVKWGTPGQCSGAHTIHFVY